MPRKRDAYLDYLARVPMFSACSKKELQAIAKRTTDVTFGEGHEIVQEGRQGYEFFVITDGRVKVSRNQRKVAELGPGDFFGELSLLDRAPRSATVTALTPVEAVVLVSQEFDSLITEAPSVTRKLLQGLAQRLREVDRTVG